MGRSNRQKPERLADKLHAIRTGLKLTQEQMIERLNCKKVPLYPASISEYEKDKREPPLLVLLAYARVAGVPMEFLVDDEQDLPDHLPLKPGNKWIMKHGRLMRE
ncbi:MAG TPA: helix-turn-helix transcriptional regulator [Pyrinomonadaceae bacterium]|jgi:transcriptional regulator with XRE-family HTH domain|nr:helix-turn-helix transcriptional regulator [Pyrinomonadaceae bacterium]